MVERSNPTSRLAVVTGATSGFGRATARHLARCGHDVCLVARDRAKADATLGAIDAAGEGRCFRVIGDLSSIADVRRVGEDIRFLDRPVHLLVNNAGAVFGLRRRTSIDGIEMTFALNHLAYHQLSLALWDQLVAASPGRVVNVASDAYAFAGGRLDVAALDAERGYRPHRQYGRTKLANILFTSELDRRGRALGIHTVAWSPRGLTATRFGYGAHRLAPLVMKITHPFALSVDEAVPPLLELCERNLAADELGQFLVCDELHHVAVNEPRDARDLWEHCDRLLESPVDRDRPARTSTRR